MKMIDFGANPFSLERARVVSRMLMIKIQNKCHDIKVSESSKNGLMSVKFVIDNKLYCNYRNSSQFISIR